MVAPVVVVICLVGIGLYFFVLRSVSEFADEQIKEALTNISSEIYNICDENFTELMQTGQMDNKKAVTIKKAITLGAIEDYAKRSKVGCRLTELKKGELLQHQIEPNLMKFIIKQTAFASNKMNMEIVWLQAIYNRSYFTNASVFKLHNILQK